MDREIINILHNSDIFKQMSLSTEQKLGVLTPKTFMPGDEISFPSSLVVILSGNVSIFAADSNALTLLNRVTTSEIVCAASAWTSGAARMSHVIASSKAQVLVIPHALLDSIISSDVDVARAYIEFLANRVYFLTRKIVGFTADRSDVALAQFFYDRWSAEQNDTLKFNMTKVASSLGIGRTTLYRAISELKAAGLIQAEGNGCIKILDAKALESYTIK